MVSVWCKTTDFDKSKNYLASGMHRCRVLSSAFFLADGWDLGMLPFDLLLGLGRFEKFRHCCLSLSSALVKIIMNKDSNSDFTEHWPTVGGAEAPSE